MLRLFRSRPDSDSYDDIDGVVGNSSTGASFGSSASSGLFGSGGGGSSSGSARSCGAAASGAAASGAAASAPVANGTETGVYDSTGTGEAGDGEEDDMDDGGAIEALAGLAGAGFFSGANNSLLVSEVRLHL